MRVLDDGEQQAFGDGGLHGVVYTNGFQSGEEYKRLEVDSHQVLPREDPLAQRHRLSPQDVVLGCACLTR